MTGTIRSCHWYTALCVESAFLDRSLTTCRWWHTKHWMPEHLSPTKILITKSAKSPTVFYAIWWLFLLSVTLPYPLHGTVFLAMWRLHHPFRHVNQSSRHFFLGNHIISRLLTLWTAIKCPLLRHRLCCGTMQTILLLLSGLEWISCALFIFHPTMWILWEGGWVLCSCSGDCIYE